MTKNKHRALLPVEIALLEAQGCVAEDWKQVQVSPDFAPDRVHETRFSGEVCLGSFRNDLDYPGGVRKPSGVYRATLHQVSVGDHARVADVRGYIAHYVIGDHARVEDVETIYVEGKTSFGNGTQVSVLHEAGGRAVCIYDTLSAQTAYLQCNYRHDELLQHRLRELAEHYSNSKQASVGTIGSFATVAHCGRIKNVHIGAWSVVEGASELEEGTLCSTKEAPVRIGRNATARQFIAMPGAVLGEGVRLLRCFVGEASYLGGAYTATDSLFFSNCHLENGEACSLFAGPFTVSHHKSTLLIGMMASFLNAGSGTNQSNHAYKLGPVHYGILERGGRTGSGSYLLWPSRIGPFSTVIGTVKLHLNTSELPFSYLIGTDEQVYIAPAATLRSIGTWRDAGKWPKRDARKATFPADVLNLEVFSAYTASRMLKAIDTLQELRRTQGDSVANYSYQGALIRRSSLEKGMTLYTQALRYWAGGLEVKEALQHPALVATACADESQVPSGNHSDWLDMGGALWTKEMLAPVLEHLRDGLFSTPEALNAAFRQLGAGREAQELAFIRCMRERIWARTLQTPEDWMQLAEDWVHDSFSLLDAVWADGQKEFAPSMKLSSGMDTDDEEEIEQDFRNAGGNPENYPFLEELGRMAEAVKATAEQLIKKLKSGKE